MTDNIGAVDLNAVRADAIRDYAEQVDGMARVGGSPALTEALFAVARHARTQAELVRRGEAR